MKSFKAILLVLAVVICSHSYSQKLQIENAFPEINEGLEYRCIGPFRGGRSAAVTGVEGKPMLFYMGSTGGGVWRTENGGTTWENISDGYFGGSIGAIEVSKSHNNVIYVGGGEVTVRGNVSPGTGMYKSIDGGRSWNQIGLEKSRHIVRVRVHPDNPDIAYAAVLGDLFKDTEERGVYKTTDGGKTWNRVLFANNRSGAVDLILDPVNPEVVYASTWNVRRTPYDFSSGGDGSELWKSNDGGKTWESLMDNKGMPEGTIGIIGVTVSPANPDRVWAIIENESGGVFRSDDGGDTWEKTNSDRSLRQRAWYYSRIYADTQDPNKVYVMNVSYHKSSDGGKTFTSANAPHGDHHDLWIAPEDPNRMVIADDGGGQVSYDGGKSWTTYMNQPTAQFYRVTTDDHFPYRIYGAQQDNSTIRIDSRAQWGMIGNNNWESTAGGESAHIAPDPKDNEIVYGGSYGGYLTRYNHHTDMNRAINVWPDNPIGYGAEGMRYRFQWNFPLFFSPHDDNKLYTCSQFLHVSYNGGQNWEIISPDLSRNDSTKLVSSGGPITKDNTGVEYYATIFAALESPYEKGLLWCGSDDGLIHVSKDAGKNWTNVTPKKLPEWSQINSIEADPFNKGGLYVAATMYRMGDYTPYLYHTKDYGQTWKLITNGIPAEHFTRVIRADQKVEGLLYCGTEFGMYISTDNGANWEPFQLNLPPVPITDLAIKDNDLIVATQGRSFWIFDDLNVIWDEVKSKTNTEELRLYSVHPTVGLGGSDRTSLRAGTNHPSGVRFYFNVPEETKNMTMKFFDPQGELIRAYSSKASEKVDQIDFEDGLNTFHWDTRYPKADDFEGMLMWWGTLQGPKAPPGIYTARLISENGDSVDSADVNFEILLDPRTEGTAEDRQAQFAFLLEIRNKLDETHDAIRAMRGLKSQMASLKSRIDNDKYASVIEEGERLDSLMTDIEKVLYQTKLKSNQDMLNFPIMLNNKLAHVASLASMGIYRPTEQMIGVAKDISSKIDVQLDKWYAIQENDIPKYNELIRSEKVDVIGVKE
ncbi:MAG: glycosyl hydrolase [Fluviicola sp. XM-24bin1]|nr:MAG: glycosyl hydrolase [Fluviicola sp. XM-24bin1]